MNAKNTLKTAITGLKMQRSRSLLTILGIVIGITAIIMVTALGQGAQNLILGEIRSIGSKVIAVAPGRQPEGPTDFISMFSDSLKEKDLAVLRKKENVPHLAKIMPIVFGSEVMAYQADTYRPTIIGGTDLFAEIYDTYPDKGRIFTEEEIKSYADVVIIGFKVKNELFPDSDALNQKVRIKGRNFRVIGILPHKGQSSFFNFDEIAVLPYTTAQRYIFGIKYFNRFTVEADSEDSVLQTVEDIRITLRNSHGITDPAKDDFFIETQASAIDMVGTITSVLTLFLASIAAISLLVGGIGIMNIMLVSVTERTREIGLRKAVGATAKDILRQFLFEAALLTMLGGIIGILLGALFSFGISLILSKALALSWAFVFPVKAALLGLIISAAVGLIFGLYPARKASSKNPIESLRYE
ncbi:MAG: ABC transporter permease [bacterium]|nr:ABC transporter permease [bacterium]